MTVGEKIRKFRIDQMTVGEKIRKFRIDQGYTQKELAIK